MWSFSVSDVETKAQRGQDTCPRQRQNSPPGLFSTTAVSEREVVGFSEGDWGAGSGKQGFADREQNLKVGMS